MAYTCFSIGLSVIAISLGFAIKNRHNAQKWIANITVGIFFSTLFMTFPTYFCVESTTKCINHWLYSIASSIFYSFKALTGKADLAQLDKIIFDGWVKSFYIAINYLSFIVAPVMASSLLISFFGDTLQRVRYLLRISPKCCVFSELNENSIVLAESIKKEPGHETIVFCNAKGVDSELSERARKIGGILLYKSCVSLHRSFRYVKYEYYLMSIDYDNNLKSTEEIVSNCKKAKEGKITINALVESGPNAEFLESIVKSKNDKGVHIRIRCVDEIALFCNDLVFKHPLYNTKGHGRNISVVIVGCGRTGMRMLKTVYWAGQIHNYKLKIDVYDKNAGTVRNEFYGQCPGLKDEKTINFTEVDVNSLQFEKEVLSKSPDATYVVVAMADDDLNFLTAEKLYRIYRRKLNFIDSLLPEIFARVRSSTKSNPFENDQQYLSERNISFFGTTKDVFFNDTLFNTRLERLAFAVDLAYSDKLALKCDSKEYNNAFSDFNKSEYKRRSSMASALHIKAKIKMCCPELPDDFDAFSSSTIAAFKENLNKSDIIEMLSRNEHDRWNAFMLTEGYEKATLEQISQYATMENGYTHKDEKSKLHPCIIDWDSLDSVQEFMLEKYGRECTFKNYDENIIKIPKIIDFITDKEQKYVPTKAIRHFAYKIIKRFIRADRKNS